MIGSYIEFAAVSNLDKDVSPWKAVRRHGKIYGRFVISGQCGDWSDRFVGIDFLGEIHFSKNQQGCRKIERVIPVRLTGKYAIRGEPIQGRAVTMI